MHPNYFHGNKLLGGITLICPKCKYEYIEGINICSTCGSTLVENLPHEEDEIIVAYVELMTVLSTRDVGLIAIVKSILEDAKIKYLAKGENLLYLGRIPVIVEIQVSKDDYELARELLKDFI